jgi:dihydroorotate dehydrogenase electron transfer subunit
MPLLRREVLDAGYQVIWFDAPEPVPAEPGHFTMVRGADWGGAPLLPRPMSLLSGGSEPSILIKVVGEGTRLMAQAAVGAPFTMLAPLGTPWRLPDDDEAALLVAGGVGVVPLISLAETLKQAERDVMSLYGGRTTRDLPLSERLEGCGELLVTTEDGSRGTAGRVTLVLDQQLRARREASRKTRVYCCGPHGMMAAVAKMAADYDVPCEASLEAPMGCGYGVCLGCAVAKSEGGYLYCCVDGPCVNAASVDWDRPVF